MADPWRLVSNVGFFAKQFMGILKSQIEIKKMFNMFSVLATMWHCCLQVENFAWIINMVKISQDLHLNYITCVDFKDYIIIKVVLVKKNNELIEEAKYFKDLKVVHN